MYALAELSDEQLARLDEIYIELWDDNQWNMDPFVRESAEATPAEIRALAARLGEIAARLERAEAGA